MPEPDHYHANLQRGSLLLDQGRARDALPFFQAAIAANPDEARGYAELARCWNEIPADRHKAIGAINRAIGLAPNVSYFYGRKGWFYICLMQYRAAKKAADEGLSINPNCITSLNALANAHTKLNQWKKAEDACRRILALNPYDAPGLNLLAQALRHQGKWKESRETVARLLANMPNNSFGHANAGFDALAAGDHLRANEHFRESLRMNPHFDLARRGLLASLRARIWIVRFNMRMRSTLQRPPTLSNLSMALVLGMGLLLVGIGLAVVLNYFFPQGAAKVVGYFVVAFLCYIYLSSFVLMLGNFLLLFDPVARHALTRREKISACVPAIVFVSVIGALLIAQAWLATFVILLVVGLLVFSIQYPLLKDHWQRRREAKSDS